MRLILPKKGDIFVENRQFPGRGYAKTESLKEFDLHRFVRRGDGRNPSTFWNGQTEKKNRMT